MGMCACLVAFIASRLMLVQVFDVVLVRLAYLQSNIAYLTAHITDFTLESFPDTTDFPLHLCKSLIHFLESLVDPIF